MEESEIKQNVELRWVIGDIYMDNKGYVYVQRDKGGPLYPNMTAKKLTTWQKILKIIAR
jgi:hypothetical protein